MPLMNTPSLWHTHQMSCELQELAVKQLEQAKQVRASPDLGPFAAQAAAWEDDVHTVGVSLGQLVMCQASSFCLFCKPDAWDVLGRSCMRLAQSCSFSRNLRCGGALQPLPQPMPLHTQPEASHGS